MKDEKTFKAFLALTSETVVRCKLTEGKIRGIRKTFAYGYQVLFKNKWKQLDDIVFLDT